MSETTKTRSTAAADFAKSVYEQTGASAKDVRAWAAENGLTVGVKGRIHPDVLSAFATAKLTNEGTELALAAA